MTSQEQGGEGREEVGGERREMIMKLHAMEVLPMSGVWGREETLWCDLSH